jgi:hypothetical protein
MATVVSRARLAHIVIENTVRQFLEKHPIETFVGCITIGQVVEETTKALWLANIAPTQGMIGEIYDAIRLYGPDGENDVIWLVHHGGPNIYCPDCCGAEEEE